MKCNVTSYLPPPASHSLLAPSPDPPPPSQLSRQHARNMEALASLREIKRSGCKGEEEVFMNFGDLFVAGKREKIEEQLKVRVGGGGFKIFF